MNRQTEERLRAAFEAKADQVTAERLDRRWLPSVARCFSTGWTTRQWTAPRAGRACRSSWIATEPATTT